MSLGIPTLSFCQVKNVMAMSQLQGCPVSSQYQRKISHLYPFISRVGFFSHSPLILTSWNIQLGDVGVWFTRRAYLETPSCPRNQHLWQSAHNSPTLQAEMKREGDEHPHLDANHGLQACGLEKKEQQQKGICFLVSG